MARRSALGDLTLDELQAAIQQQGPTDGPQNNARVQGAMNAIAKVASGQTLAPTDIEAAVVGAASMVNPAIGATLAVGVTALNVVASAMQAAFVALGLGANGGPPYVPCDPPPAPGDADYTVPNDAAAKYQALAVANTPPGSFERFAAPIIAHNAAMGSDCLAAVDPEALLAQLQVTWNQSHAPPGEQVPIGKGPVTPGGTFGGEAYGPVTYDLLQRPWYLDENGNAQPTGVAWGNPAATYPEPLRDLSINRGALLPAYQGTLLHLVPPLVRASSVAGQAAPSASMSTGAKVAVASGVLAATAGVAWAAWQWWPQVAKLFRAGRIDT